MTSLYLLLSAALLGFGIGAWLAKIDTPRQLHKPAMGGPKLRDQMVRRYRLVALLGIGAWVLAASLTNSPLYHWEGFVGMIVGVVIFNIVDRRALARHMG